MDTTTAAPKNAAPNATDGNDQALQRYARLLVEHGAGLRSGQPLFIHGERAHRDLALRVAEVAYDLGAPFVSFRLPDPLEQAQLIRRGRPDAVHMAFEDQRRWYNEILQHRGAIISLRGDEFPRLMADLAESHPERHRLFTESANAARALFHAHGINRNITPWVVAGAVTTGWAQTVFPDLPEDEAVAQLSGWIYTFTRADRDDAVAALGDLDNRLHARRRLLDSLEIRELRITGGGSDLRVGLAAEARWLGGSKTTADGQTYNANVPSEENFTTPDWRHTHGRLAATMPFRTKTGILVEDLVMDFEDGRLVDFSASRGEEPFRRWVDSDVGARQLGEVALVGGDSPIAQSGLFFEHTLYDENASCHVALGQAYATALRGGPEMGAKQLEGLGVNRSSIHTDIMFGSDQVSIHASQSKDGEVPLIVDGRWVEPFLEPTAS